MSSSSESEIRFYEKGQAYYEFSNYYTHKTMRLVIGGKLYASSEHFFQAAKFDYPGACEASLKYAEEIRQANTPNIARELASQKRKGGYKWRTDLNVQIDAAIKDGVAIRSDWDAVKLDVMYEVVLKKFRQNPETLGKLLLSTGQAALIEASPRDSFWGEGKDGTGSNHLGRILERVRERLRGEGFSP
jgi:ribA/ribD-fused uncharacterized protein